jgi:NADP-dependent 3-hydroxy acid dehydrogenase YdfG/Tfp pilus assembly protein PilF
MDKIILAYCRDNADLAQKIDDNLSRVGIPFEHLTNQPGAMPGQFAAWVQSTNSPVILLITDNFLKNQSCMSSALSMFQQLLRSERVLTIVADGKIDIGNGDFEATNTQFDRVVHAIQYMNFWQSSYLELRAQKDNVTENDAEIFESRLNIVRDISSEIGDFLNLLRDCEYRKMSDFEQDSYKMFFLRFGIMDWHQQYSLLDNVQSRSEIKPKPLQTPTVNTSVATQNLVTIPEEIPAKNEDWLVAVPTRTVSPEFEKLSDNDDFIHELKKVEVKSTDFLNDAFQEDSETDHLVDEIIQENFTASNTENWPQIEDEPTESLDYLFEEQPIIETVKVETDWAANINKQLSSAQRPIETRILKEQPFNPTPLIIPQTTAQYIALTIKDAEYWLEKGQHEQAFKAFELAIEDYPEDVSLQKNYLSALSKHGNTEKAIFFIEEKIKTPELQAQAFDSLAENCLVLGDVETARIIWEKTALINPTHPDIFYKLGKLADKNEPESNDAATEYLKMAVKQTPDNAEIHYNLAQILQKHKPKKAIKYLLNTVGIEPQHPSAWMDLALNYQKIEENANAATCFAKAVEINPALNTDANRNLFHPIAKAQVIETPKQIVKKDILTVLITGATSGIGKATAELFAQNGHRLILIGRREDRLLEIKTLFEKDYQNEIHTVSFDVRDYKSAEKALQNLPENWQNIDILLNNAGLARGLDFIHEGDLEHWETMIDTNIKGLLYMTRLISPNMVQRRKGHIINISSTAGKEVYPKGNVYCATKHAVEALTKAMRMDLHNHNIRVSEVSPGMVEETEFALTRFDGDAEKAQIYKDFQPLKASDVAEIIYFIATRPAHVNIQDVLVMGTQQASSTVVDRSGR